jgi:hypothetical protein
VTALPIETIAIELLRPHPRNYVTHPPAQLAHLVASIQEHGFYRNIIIARDSTILAGHGAVEAARQLGMVEVPALRLSLDPMEARALQVLAGDNEIMRLRIPDDRALAELFKDILETDPGGLLGTGYDDASLASLLAQGAAQTGAQEAWQGMPAFDQPEIMSPLKCIVHFETEADRAAFEGLIGQQIPKHNHAIWYPRQRMLAMSKLEYYSNE